MFFLIDLFLVFRMEFGRTEVIVISVRGFL